MSDFIDRLKIEIEELAEKVTKLTEFLQTETFNQLTQHNQDLLAAQLMTMLNYLTILGLREKLLTSSS